VVRSRILIAVGAWLLGAVTATAGSLLAVSQLSLGVAGSTSQQLTISSVNSALAAEKSEQPASASARPLHIAPPHTAHRPPPAVHAAHAVHPAARGSAAAPSSPPGTLLTSRAGSVLATCQAAGAYLLSWSPQQGFEALDVVRGPAGVASVRFAGQFDALIMRVTCSGGVPTMWQSTWSGAEGRDGGGGGE
jgi:hypothetical protein